MSIYQRTSRNSAPAQKSAEALGEITVEGRLDSTASVDSATVQAAEVSADAGAIVEAKALAIDADSIVEGTGVEVACLQGAKGDKGEKGDRGDKGDKGDTPDISAAAQTLPAGSAASVERSGTPSSPIFTFGIPKGDKGDQGPTGEKGEKGDKGDTPNISAASQTLPAGSAASVSRSGTNENPVFTFGIPKGDKGDQGDKGEQGDKGDQGDTPDISAAAYTLPAGSSASVGRTGTASSPLFTFGIPKGDKGDKGEKGERGEQGESAVTAVENSFIANLF